MTWLTLFFALEIGMLPNYGFIMYESPETVIANDSFYTDFETSVEVHGFYAGGGMRCYFWNESDGYDFYPYQMTFRFDTGWRNDKFNIGFRHYCMHPVFPWIGQLPEQKWEGSYEELFVRFEGRTR